MDFDKVSQKRPKNEHFVKTHFKAVFRGDLNSGGQKCHFNLACDYGHARGLKRGRLFFTKNKNGNFLGFSESFSKFIPINLRTHWNELQNSFQPIS